MKTNSSYSPFQVINIYLVFLLFCRYYFYEIDQQFGDRKYIDNTGKEASAVIADYKKMGIRTQSRYSFLF